MRRAGARQHRDQLALPGLLTVVVDRDQMIEHVRRKMRFLEEELQLPEVSRLPGLAARIEAELEALAGLLRARPRDPGSPGPPLHRVH